MDKRLIQFHQVCAIAKMILQAEPTIDDAEWKARVMDCSSRQGWESPPSDMLSRAMTQVEQALKQTIGPRPVLIPTSPNRPPTQGAPPSSRSQRPAGWEIVVGLMTTLKTSVASAPSSAQPDGPRETLAVSEERALDEFWRAANRDTADRVALLRAFAEIAIVRPATWNPAEIRAHAHEHRLQLAGCFSCRRADGRAAWHHVIQIQFGGSNYLRNRVALCDACHAAVHPWLPTKPAKPESWSHVSACGADVIAMLKREIA